MCISFVYEDGDKGPSAKDLRAEDPDRVARVTAKKIYGKVEVRRVLVPIFNVFLLSNPQ